jgi:hypothetical protein
MYANLLLVHSVLRWLVLLAGLMAAATAWREVSGWQTARAGRLFIIFLDTQVLAGLILYFLVSPITTAAIHHLGPAMSNAVVRFWAIEHPAGMIAALALAHIARAKTRNGRDVRQRRRAAIYFTLAIALIILTTPWPFLPYGRPLL